MERNPQKKRRHLMKALLLRALILLKSNQSRLGKKDSQGLIPMIAAMMMMTTSLTIFFWRCRERGEGVE
jgi:hypothetical protein